MSKELIKEISEHRDKMFFVAVSICRDDMTAEDVVQDATINAIEKIHQFNSDKAGLGTWLCQITRNCALQRYRNDKLPKAELNDEIMLVEEEEEDWSDDLELHADVIEAIGKIKVLVRYDLVDDFIAYYSGAKGHKYVKAGRRKKRAQEKTLSYQEIADKHDIKMNTLKTAFNRAIQSLRMSSLNPNNTKI